LRNASKPWERSLGRSVAKNRNRLVSLLEFIEKARRSAFNSLALTTRYFMISYYRKHIVTTLTAYRPA